MVKYDEDHRNIIRFRKQTFMTYQAPRVIKAN